MRTSLCTQSLFSLSLGHAIDAASTIGYEAIELACTEPHFSYEAAQTETLATADQIEEKGMAVSALSLFNPFTNEANLEEEIRRAQWFIKQSDRFHTKIIKLTPGPPSSKEAREAHWLTLSKGIEAIAPLAEDLGVRLAFETHMRHLTDTLAGTLRLLDASASPAVGLTIDILNLAFAGEDIPAFLNRLAGRTFNVHVKNGQLGNDGAWRFEALNQGILDYGKIIPWLRDLGYDGYLAIECLGQDAKEHPIPTAERDLRILKDIMESAAKTPLQPSPQGTIPFNATTS